MSINFSLIFFADAYFFQFVSLAFHAFLISATHNLDQFGIIIAYAVPHGQLSIELTLASIDFCFEVSSSNSQGRDFRYCFDVLWPKSC